MTAPVVDQRELDCENAARGVWIVKVPKYLSTEWEKAAPRSEIGRLKIIPRGGRHEILFDVADAVVEKAAADAPDVQIPKEHKFSISDIPHQSLAVFAYSKDEKNRLRTKLEGHVVQKGECRPKADASYMNLKFRSIKQASQPTRQVMQLDKAVVNYKPVAMHKNDVEFEQKRKAEGKKARDDKDKVLELLFPAFEKHQYYALKDLVRITKQPTPYLKEILNEFCIYNSKNPHQNTWELKPEYRHYNKNDAS